MTDQIINKINALFPTSGPSDEQAFQNLIDLLNKDVLPKTTDKQSAIKVISYFEGMKSKAPDYIKNEGDLIEATKMLMRAFGLFVQVNPDNFDLNLNYAAKFVSLATSIGGHSGSSKAMQRFNKDFNDKGIAAQRH